MTIPYTLTYELPVLTTPDGQSTCSVGTGEGETCPFLHSRMFGQVALCLMPKLPEPVQHLIHRGEEGRGYTVPHKQCPVHSTRLETRHEDC